MARAAPEPAQLARDAVRRRRDGQRRAAHLRRRARAAPRALHRRHARAGGDPEPRPGLRFRYLPARAASHPANFDSPEYANIVLGFSRHYAAARAAGMPVPVRLGLLRQWAQRAISGYWTHAGQLNWDTGLGFQRWHQSKKVPLAQAALLGVATAPELQPGPDGRLGEVAVRCGAAAIRGRGGRSRHAATSGGLRPARGRPGPRERLLTAARYSGNAMRALTAGLGRVPAQPPARALRLRLRHGRLAVTTPAYSTAIVAVNHRAFPYGGLDLTRLFDARSEPVGGIGGVAPAAFGLQVVDADGQLRLRTAYGARGAGATQPLRLTHAPAPSAPSGRDRSWTCGCRGRSGADVCVRAARTASRPTPSPRAGRCTGAGRAIAHTSPSRAGAAPRACTRRCATAAACAWASAHGRSTRRLAGPRGLHRSSPARSARRARPRRPQRSLTLAPDPGPTLVVDLPAAVTRSPWS